MRCGRTVSLKAENGGKPSGQTQRICAFRIVVAFGIVFIEFKMPISIGRVKCVFNLSLKLLLLWSLNKLLNLCAKSYAIALVSEREDQ